ncbi:MAG: M28 family peptidase [Planctomycetes bacterium]|nr:M28 family peptidase [Planctomycetota bacterium]
MLKSLIAVGALLYAAGASDPSDQHAALENVRSEGLLTVALEHGGDFALRDKLVRAYEVWHDAGDFLVARIPASRVEGLRARSIGVVDLGTITAGDSLFAVDLAKPDAAAELEHARILYRHGNQAVAAVRDFVDPTLHLSSRRHTCHSGHAAILQRRIQPTQPLIVQGAPWTSGSQALASADPRIQTLVNQVVKTNLSSFDQTLSALFSRLSTNNTYVDNGRNVITSQLTTYGIAYTLQAVPSTQGDNVIVTFPGSVNPNQYVVIGAHYDSINGSGSTQTAPGADDNGSGSAAVMELARILKNAGPFENSIRLIWFCGEEQGLLGSDYNATQSLAAGEQILAMLNTDMNAYRNPADTRDCDFTDNSSSASLTAFCRATAPLYVANWADKTGTLTAGSSDHASYNAHGIPAAFFFEDLTQYSPYIHTANDTFALSCNDWDLSLMITQGILACAATLAEPLDMTIAHTELGDTTNATGPYAVASTVTSQIGSNVTAVNVWFSSNGGTNWTSTAASAVGSVWTAFIPSQGSPKTILYYIEALDDQGNREVAPSGADAGGATYDFFVGTKTPIYVTGFEEGTDNGWTHAQVATQDDWQRGVPMGQSGDPSSAYAGTKVWGNDLGPSGWNGAYTNSVNNYLRSPAINCSAQPSVTLEFRRWLGVEAGSFDQAQIKVNNTVVWSNPSGADLIDSSWVPMSIDISSIAGGNPSVQVEFRMISDAGVSFGGWNIDAFQLVALGPGSGGCTPPATYCTSKVNSQFCSPAIASSGQPSATAAVPFDITASQVLNKKNGLLFYGSQPLGASFQGGHLCVKLPITRTSVQTSGGSPTGTDCTGTFSYDFNALIQGGTDPSLVQGATVYAQYWYRDPADLSGFFTGLTEGLSFQICP